MVSNTIFYKWFHSPECNQARKELNRQINVCNALSQKAEKSEKQLSAKKQENLALMLSHALDEMCIKSQHYQSVHLSSGCTYGERFEFLKGK